MPNPDRIERELQFLADEIAAENPGISPSEARRRAERAQMQQAGALPDPEYDRAEAEARATPNAFRRLADAQHPRTLGDVMNRDVPAFRTGPASPIQPEIDRQASGQDPGSVVAPPTPPLSSRGPVTPVQGPAPLLPTELHLQPPRMTVPKAQPPSLMQGQQLQPPMGAPQAAPQAPQMGQATPPAMPAPAGSEEPLKPVPGVGGKSLDGPPNPNVSGQPQMGGGQNTLGSGMLGGPIGGVPPNPYARLAEQMRLAQQQSQQIARRNAIGGGIGNMFINMANAQGARLNPMDTSGFADPNAPIQQAQFQLDQQRRADESAGQLAFRQQQAESQDRRFQASLAERQRATDASLGMQAEMMGLRDQQFQQQRAELQGEGSRATEEAELLLGIIRANPRLQSLIPNAEEQLRGRSPEALENVWQIVTRETGRTRGGGGGSSAAPNSDARAREVDAFLRTTAGQRAIADTFGTEQAAREFYIARSTKEWGKVMTQLATLPVSAEGRGQGSGASTEGANQANAGREVVPGVRASVSLTDNQSEDLRAGLTASRELIAGLNRLDNLYGQYSAAIAANPAAAEQWRGRVMTEARVLAGKISRMNDTGVITQGEMPSLLQSLGASQDENTLGEFWRAFSGRGSAAISEWRTATLGAMESRAAGYGMDPSAVRGFASGRTAGSGGGTVMTRNGVRKTFTADQVERARAAGWR